MISYHGSDIASAAGAGLDKRLARIFKRHPRTSYLASCICLSLLSLESFTRAADCRHERRLGNANPCDPSMWTVTVTVTGDQGPSTCENFFKGGDEEVKLQVHALKCGVRAVTR